MLRTKNGDFSLVPVILNGNHRQLLLATAGFVTQLTQETASDLNLTTQTDQNIHFTDINRNTVNQVATVHTFLFGPYAARNLTVPVMSNFGVEKANAAGIISGDFLFPTDVDLDLKNDLLSLYLPDHCADGVTWWNSGVGVGIVPMQLTSTRADVKITLNGRPYSAIVDTSSLTSKLSQTVADSDFKTTEDWSNDIVSEPTNGEPAGHYHKFASLSFGDLTINTPRLLMLADKLNFGSPATNSKNPPIIIGMDILKRLHMYFAVHQGKLYVSEQP